MLTGGCYCGRVRYQVEHPPLRATLCHCGICRGISGAPMTGWLSVPIQGFRFTEGQPTEYRSSRRATRTFCPNCGGHLTYRLDTRRREIDLTIGSLDEPDAVTPQDQQWVRKRLAWASLRLDLPEHEENRHD